MSSFYLIDAHAYLHRAFHALPPLTTSQGQPVNAIYGFLRMLTKIIRQYKPDYLAVCFDAEGPTFRHKAYKDYKATRKEIDASLVSQFPLAREAVEAMGIAGFELSGWEADDIIAHLTREGRKAGHEVVIVSGDKDALQLVGEGVKVLSEQKDILFDPEKVQERWGVLPAQIPDIFSLMGDTSDNVPGIPGIGEKTAIKLIQEHGTLEKLLASAGSVKGKVGTLLATYAQSARDSWALVSLHHEVPLNVDWNACQVHPPNPATLTPFLQRMEFSGLLKDLVPTSPVAVDTSDRNYQTLVTEADLKKWVAAAAKSDKVAVDVETTGLDPLRAALVGISLSYQKDSACYIPVGHRGLNAPTQLPLVTVQKYLAPLLKGDHPKVYGHNLKFDAVILERHGIAIGKLHCDTMVASYVLNPSRNGHGLKDLALEFLNERMTPIEQLIGKGAKQITMEEVEVAQAAPYAAADADMTLRLAELFEPHVNSKGLAKLFYEMEMPLVTILADMEKKGIRVDQIFLSELGRQLKARAAELEKEIFRYAGETFNINSSKQLSVILFERLKLPVIRRTKTGISTDEEVLLKLSVQHPLPKTLIEYREIQKLYSTYVDGLQAALTEGDGRVHTSFNQTVAATGRLSSSSPNLQNIPIRTPLGRQIRKAFVPTSGSILLSADYSQIDLRMLAHISQDPTLVQAFRKGDDIHTMTACEIFGVTPEGVTADLRRVAKSINFGIVYGISAFGLAQQLQIPADQAKQHIERYFERYPGVRRWIDQTLQEAREKGFVRTLLGRIRYLPEIQSKNSQIRGFAERTAMNTPIQGTSADLIKLAMIEVEKAKALGKWQGDMLLQVHDELLFEIPITSLETSAQVLKKIMEEALILSIPVVVDLKSGSNWTEMKPLLREGKAG